MSLSGFISDKHRCGHYIAGCADGGEQLPDGAVPSDLQPVPQERFDLLKDGTEIKNPEGQFCEWILEFHLGRVRGVHRKKMDARRKG